MAKYLRPRRGSKANAQAQKIKLQKGEMFMEFPNGYIGKEPGRIVIGDGATSYNSLDYATSATNVFQPFITDPSIYIPRFANTATSTGSGAVNSAMTSIEKMGNGSTASTVTLPTIVSAVKEALVYHANSITKLNNDLAGKASASTLSNYIPYTSTDTHNNSTYTWKYPNASTNSRLQYTEQEYYSSLFNGSTITYDTYIAGNGGISLISDTYSTNLSPNHHMRGSLSLTNNTLRFADYHDTPYDSDAQYLKIEAVEAGKWDIYRVIRKNGTTYGWGGSAYDSLDKFLKGYSNVVNLSNTQLRAYTTSGSSFATVTSGIIYIIRFGPIISIKLTNIVLSTSYSSRVYLRTNSNQPILQTYNIRPVTETGSYAEYFFASNGDIMLEGGKGNMIYDTSVYFTQDVPN